MNIKNSYFYKTLFKKFYHLIENDLFYFLNVVRNVKTNMCLQVALRYRKIRQK